MRSSFPTLLLACAFVVLTPTAQAQAPAEDPDWAEAAAPPPPAFDPARAVPLNMPSSVSLAYGIDPKTVSIGTDGIVRYVLVATSRSGAVNAIYEGIRCDNGTAKTYARNAGSGWNLVQSPDWRTLFDGSAINTATLAFARQGGCMGHSRPRTVEELLRTLKSPYASGYSP